MYKEFVFKYKWENEDNPFTFNMKVEFHCMT